MSNNNLHDAYSYCIKMTQNHYENFPVASHLLGRELRNPISVVYAFARTADDFADEGELSSQQRLEFLEDYTSELILIDEAKNTGVKQQSKNPIFIALRDVIHNYNIPIQLFHDLLTAFKSDVSTSRYHNFDQIMDYCHNSANPVGRILLYLNNSASQENLSHSDAICSGLQLINFYQDIYQDISENDRLYIPLEEMDHYSVTVNDIKNKTDNLKTHSLMLFQIQRAKQLFESGKPLCSNLSGRFAIEIRMIFSAGSLILDKLAANISSDASIRKNSSIYLRPRLTSFDKLKILWRGLFW